MVCCLVFRVGGWGLGFGGWGSGFWCGWLEISAKDAFDVFCFDLVVVSSFDFWFRHHESSMGLGVFVALISTGFGFWVSGFRISGFGFRVLGSQW